MLGKILKIPIFKKKIIFPKKISDQNFPQKNLHNKKKHKTTNFVHKNSLKHSFSKIISTKKLPIKKSSKNKSYKTNNIKISQKNDQISTLKLIFLQNTSTKKKLFLKKFYKTKNFPKKN